MFGYALGTFFTFGGDKYSVVTRDRANNIADGKIVDKGCGRIGASVHRLDNDEILRILQGYDTLSKDIAVLGAVTVCSGAYLSVFVAFFSTRSSSSSASAP